MDLVSATAFGISIDLSIGDNQPEPARSWMHQCSYRQASRSHCVTNFAGRKPKLPACIIGFVTVRRLLSSPSPSPAFGEPSLHPSRKNALEPSDRLL